jgi:hypothetical protein
VLRRQDLLWRKNLTGLGKCRSSRAPEWHDCGTPDEVKER